MRKKSTPLPALGWREYVALPDLGIQSIKAKVDTGARSSALHAWNIELIQIDDEPWVSFDLHPIQKNNKLSVTCHAPLVAEKCITSSNGHKESRFVVRTRLSIGRACYPIDVSLTNRDSMGFRMLLGRTSIRERFVVDPGCSYQMPLDQSF